MITVQDLLTSSGKYPERANSHELTQEFLNNADTLINTINSFFQDLGIDTPKISSGFRPSDVNAKIKNAAKQSLHQSCRAVDFDDVSGELDKLIVSRDDLKKKYSIWQEACGSSSLYPDKTPSWCHLDNKDRGHRADNIFNP